MSDSSQTSLSQTSQDLYFQNIANGLSPTEAMEAVSAYVSETLSNAGWPEDAISSGLYEAQEKFNQNIENDVDGLLALDGVSEAFSEGFYTVLTQNLTEQDNVMLEHLSEIFPEGSNPSEIFPNLMSNFAQDAAASGLPSEMINAANAASQEAFQNALDSGQSAEDAFVSAIEAKQEALQNTILEQFGVSDQQNDNVGNSFLNPEVDPGQLTADYLSEIPEGEFSELTPFLISQIPSNAFSQLAGSQLENIPPTSLITLQAGQLDAIPSEALSSFTSEQIAQMPEDVFSSLDPADKIKEFSADEFSGIKLEHLSFMSSDVLENIDNAQIAKLDSSILSEIDVTIFSSLTSDALAGFTSTQLNGMDPESMARFSQGDDLSNLGYDGLSKFSPDAISGLTDAHFQNLPIGAMASLSFEHIENIDPEAISGLTSSHFASITPLNLHALSKAQIEEITPDVMSELSSLGFVISNDYSSIFNPQMEFQQILGSLQSDEPLTSEITATLIANLHPNEMTELNAEFISDIPSNAFSGLSAEHLGNIPDSAFSNLTERSWQIFLLPHFKV